LRYGEERGVSEIPQRSGIHSGWVERFGEGSAGELQEVKLRANHRGHREDTGQIENCYAPVMSSWTASLPVFLRGLRGNDVRSTYRNLRNRRDRVERYSLVDSLPFCDRVNFVGADIFESFDFPRRPANFHQIDLRRRAQPKVHTQIILREIA